MKFEEFFDQMEQIKKAFIKASKDFDCDDVIPINCIEGGYAPNEDTNVLVFSSGKEKIEEILEKIFGTPTINADDMDVGAKIEGLFEDDNL